MLLSTETAIPETQNVLPHIPAETRARAVRVGRVVRCETCRLGGAAESEGPAGGEGLRLGGFECHGGVLGWWAVSSSAKSCSGRGDIIEGLPLNASLSVCLLRFPLVPVCGEGTRAGRGSWRAAKDCHVPWIRGWARGGRDMEGSKSGLQRLGRRLRAPRWQAGIGSREWESDGGGTWRGPGGP